MCNGYSFFLLIIVGIILEIEIFFDYPTSVHKVRTKSTVHFIDLADVVYSAMLLTPPGQCMFILNNH